MLTGFQYQRRICERSRAPPWRACCPGSATSGGMGSAALELCAIAAGRADAYVEEGLHLWDRAAAGLVATEAGARVGVHPGVGGMDCVVCAPAAGFAEVLRRSSASAASSPCGSRGLTGVAHAGVAGDTLPAV